jgi:multiple sugar transport system substrate-binding protein
MRRRRGSFNIHALLYGLVVLILLTGGIRWFAGVGTHNGNKIRLSFWNGFTGPDGVVMLDIINHFNQENPDVEVNMQRIPWATYYNKLTVAGSDGRGPEVFIVHTDALPRIRRAGFVGDASSLFTPSKIHPDDFDPYVLKHILFQGKYAGVPLDIHPQGMYCNADMLKKAGIVDKQGNPVPPRTKEEFLAAIKAMTIEPGPGHPDKQWGFAFTYWGANFRNLVPQFGGQYIDDSGRAVLNSPENVRALQFLEEIAKQNMAPPADNQLGWFGFRTKRVAIVWDGVFMLGDLMRLNDMNYLGAPIPTIGDHPGALANSHVLCMRASLTDRERDAAERFIHYVSDHSIEWAAAGQVPARRSVRANPEFAKLQVQSAFAKQIPYLMYPPRTPVIFEFSLAMDLAVESVVRKHATAEEALDKANKDCQDLLDRDRAEHPEDGGAQ